MACVSRTAVWAATFALGAFLACGVASAQTTVRDWNGIYAGLHVGGAWGEENDNLSDLFDDLEPPPPPPPGNNADSFDLGGVLGGAHAGYDWQHGPLVLGVQGIFDGSGVDGDHDQDASFRVNSDATLEIDGNLSFEQRWQAAFVGKVGAALGNLQLYGLGGLAVSEGHLQFSGTGSICTPSCGTPEPFSVSASETHIGWTAGGGGQYAFSERWSAVVEGRFTDFGSESYGLDGEGPEGDVDVDFNLFSVTGGISYHF